MGLGTSRSHSGNCDSQYYLKIINYIGEQLRRSDIFVAASAAEEKNAVGVAFSSAKCALKETALLLEELFGIIA